MAILDIFKRKKPASAKPARQVGGATAGKAEKKPKPATKPESSVSITPKPKKFPEQAYRVLAKPHITEKAGDLTAKNQYVFEIFPQANKFEVKRAVEDLYGVDVEGVRIINIPRKQKIFKGRRGWSGGYKKAIIKIKAGQKIEILPR